MAEIGREYIDDLTGLHNRRYLNQRVPEEIEDALESNRPLSIVLIDLDYFKNVNDTYGHIRGDDVLKEFADFLKRTLRQDDTVSRYGGDEFVCIFPNTEYERAARISQRSVERCRIEEFARVTLTMSVGIASYPKDGRDWPALFQIADRNLYSAKRHGRDRIGLFARGGRELAIPTEEIVGRDAELGIIRESTRRISQGRGGAACISGEIGVGKTRLVHESARQPGSPSFRFFSSNLSATTRSIPYYPFREIIRSVINEEGKRSVKQIGKSYQIELSKIAPELSTETNDREKHAFMVDKYRLFEGVKELLTQCVRSSPMLVFFDNIQWADDGSLELLHYLLRTLRDFPIFFFFAYRVEESKDSLFERTLHLMAREGLYEMITIEPLESSDVAKMIALIIDDSPPRELIDYVVRETGGNPLFIEEIMKSIERDAALTWVDDRWAFDDNTAVTIPHSIESVVAQKLDMMNSDARNVMEHAAVIGRAFDFTLLKNITRMNEGHLLDLMDEIMESRLLKENSEGSYYFNEDIIREIVYSKMGKAKSRHYHRMLGNELLSLHEGHVENVVEELSLHFFLGEDRQRAIEYSIVAGDRAKAVYANQDAIRFYTRAIECLEDEASEANGARGIVCLKKRSEVLSLVGEFEKAADDLEKGIVKAKASGDRKSKADCLLELCKNYLHTDRYHDAIGEAEVALEMYRALGDSNSQADCLNNIGNAHWFLGEYQVALKFYRSSLRISHETGDRELEAKCIGNIAIVYWSLGEYSKAFEYYSDALEIMREIGDRQGEGRGHSNIALICQSLGEYPEALEHLKNSLEISAEIGERGVQTSALNNIGILYAHLGEYSRALECHEKSLKITREIGTPKVEALNLNNIGIIHGITGKYSLAMECFKRCLNISKDIGDRQTEIEGLLSIGFLCVETNDLASAKGYLDEAHSMAREVESKPLLLEVSLGLASLYLIEGNYKEARAIHDLVLRFAEELNSREITARALCLSGRVYTQEKEWDRARSSFEQSISILQGLKWQIELGKSHYYQGLMFKEKTEIDDAKESFAKARSIFEYLHARRWKERVLGESANISLTEP